MNNNQYGFIPQKSTTDEAIAVRHFVQEGLKAGEVLILVSLDVKCAFDAAWWPSILKNLQVCGCTKNLYNITRNYFRQRTAILSTNNIRMKREVR
jgi:hypothetical protein